MTLQSSRKTRRRPKPVALGCGASIVLAYVVVAVLAPLIAPYDPLALDPAASLLPPSPTHVFGTDSLGRDQFSRVVYAARMDLLIGFAAASGAALIGSATGLLSGYGPAWLDMILTRVMDLLQILPAIVLLVALLLVFGSSTGGLIFAILIVAWVPYARLMRSEVLVAKNLDYVTAARLAGLGSGRVLVRHLLPNTWAQTFIYLTTDVMLAIVLIASLGYLGMGVQPPEPEWGAMIADGQAYLVSAPWLTVIPGLVIALLGFGLALISDGLTDSVGKDQK